MYSAQRGRVPNKILSRTSVLNWKLNLMQKLLSVEPLQRYCMQSFPLLFSSALYESETSQEVKDRGINAVSIWSDMLYYVSKITWTQASFWLPVYALSAPSPLVVPPQWLIQFLMLWRCFRKRISTQTQLSLCNTWTKLFFHVCLATEQQLQLCQVMLCFAIVLF